MGPYRELFVDAEDAIERERIAAATRRWDAVLRDLYPPTERKALQLVRELDLEARIGAYVRIGPDWRRGLVFGMSDLLAQ